MSDEPLGRELPNGLQLQSELTAHGGAQGRVFEAVDSRGGTEAPIQRIARFVQLADERGQDGTYAREAFLKRLQRLLGVHLPHALTPHEAGHLSDGTIYLVDDAAGQALQPRAGQGLGRPRAERWLHELLLGLAALHRLNLAHGDVRPANMFVTDGDGGSVRLADAVVGPMTWWTAGDRLVPDATRYHPPEWKGGIGAPTPQADLYAAALAGCELLLGTKAVAGLRNAEGVPDRQALRRRLRHAGVGRPLRTLLNELLDPFPMERPSNADQALRRWRKLEAGARRRTTAAGSVVAVMLLLGTIVFGLLWSGARSDLAEAERENTSLEEQTEELTTQLETCEERIRQLESEHKRLEADRQRLIAQVEGLGETPDVPVVATDEVKRLWTEIVGKELDYAEERQKLTDRFNSHEDDETSDEGLSWIRSVRPLYGGAPRWLDTDSHMQERFDAARQAPWDDEAVEAARAYLDALEEAERHWRRWARDDDLEWSDIERLIDNPAISDDARAVLDRWRRALLAQSTEPWRLRITGGSVPEGWGTPRQPGVRGRDGWAYDEVHAWESETGHRYDPPRTLRFSWEPGDPIAIRLWGERRWFVKSGRRARLIHDTIEGPLALWRLHDRGYASESGGEAEFRLELEIENCPGPPPRRGG